MVYRQRRDSHRPRYVRNATVIWGFVIVLVAQFAVVADESGTAKPDDILIIVNNSVDIDQIQPDEVRAIFLKRKMSWSDGTKAVPINAPDGTRIREDFRRLIVGMNQNKEQIYWQKQMIKHGRNRPPEFPNPLKAVFKLRGSGSYVYRSDFKKNVAKVILVLPREAGS